MSLSNAALFKRWFDFAWNHRHDDVNEELLAEDIRVFGISEEPVIGNEVCREYWRLCMNAFTEIDMVVEDTISEDDRVAARFKATALHSGEAFEIEPTGFEVSLQGALFTTWEDGQIVEAHVYIDVHGFHRQIDPY